MKRKKNKQPQFCSPPRSQRLMAWLLTWSLLRDMAKSFPSLGSGDLSFFQEEVWPWASLQRWRLVPEVMRWTVRRNEHCDGGPAAFPGSMLGTSESPWTYFCCPQGENITDPHFSFITCFRGWVSLNVIQMKKKKKTQLKTNSQMLLEQLLFIRTRRVPEVSTYTTHIKTDWFINLQEDF